jgi:aspartate-semialdehyde dehydrogenase
LSGAGYPGIPSLDILDNVIPFISGEEEKLQIEPRKILGKITNNNSKFEDYPITLSAHCNRYKFIFVNNIYYYYYY